MVINVIDAYSLKGLDSAVAGIGRFQEGLRQER